MQKRSISIKIGDHELVFETGHIARQANGSVIVRQGDTMVFAAACAAKAPAPDADFFPLRVDYQEKFSSAGKTLGGFIKREGRPSEREILVSRLIDRPLRPMFEEGFLSETQLLSYVWSYDGKHQPDVLAICAASAALVISDIPLLKPIGAVRVAMLEGQFVLNPSPEQMEKSKLDLVLAGTQDAILMIEGHCDFLTEEQVLQAITFGHRAIQHICGGLTAWAQKIGKPKNRTALVLSPKGLKEEIETLFGTRLQAALRVTSKEDREEELDKVKTAVMEHYFPEVSPSEHKATDVLAAYKEIQSKIMRRMILDDGIRCDGRGIREIRPIYIDQSFLPRAHGSSVFTRGETQSVAVCTLGSTGMAQRYEDLRGEGSQRFYLQYSFPPFSVGEVGRVGAPGRREVGHGKLAERALQATLPTTTAFPYTIRLESNITESNGSSSMASVCGGCLAMMDAGVPIARPVSGIAMGLILEGSRYTILSDILGVEDALGDMDFKVAGDREGITAFQMDIKVEGITPEVMAAALEQAKEGRIHILDKMTEICPASRQEMSAYAPRITTIQVPQSKIGTIIGPGGKQIRAIIEQTKAQIDIDDSGLVNISANDAEAMAMAKQIIEGLIAEVEVGRTYHGKVTSVVDFGVFVEILPGKEGLCHISELDTTRVEDIRAYIKQGAPITVKVLEINERGQLKLSRKATLAQRKEG